MKRFIPVLLLALCIPALAQTLQPVSFPVFRAMDSNGKPLSGGLLYSYAAGTTTPLVTYKDAIGTPNENPVVLDSTGTARVYLGNSAYKLVLKNQFDVQQWTVDNLINSNAGLVSFTPNGDQTITQPVGTSLNVNILNNVYNASQFCTTPGTLDQSCISNAVIAANGKQVYVPAGTYSGTTSNLSLSNVNLVLDHDANLNYALNILGAGYTKSSTVSSPGTYASGVTTFSGNFSAYSAGQVVVIDQVTPTTSNQIGSEFATVASATSSNIVITSPTRFTYATPNISKTTNAKQASGDTMAGSISISGDFTSVLAVGDLVRVDNTTGTDAFDGITGYFEIKKVASITSAAVTFEQVIHEDMGNPWLVKINALNNISIKGGTIKNLTIANAEKVDVDGMNTGSFVADLIYNFRFTNLRGSTSTDPAVFTLFWLWQGAISNILGYGSVTSTDNGNVKLSGIQDVAVSNVSSWYGTATAQGNYQFMVDFNFTPYNIWNANDSITGISGGSQNGGGGGASIFLGGLRNSSVAGITGSSVVEFLAGDNVVATSINASGQISFRSGTGYVVSGFYADSMSMGDDADVTNSQFSNFTINGGATAFFSRSIYIRGGVSGASFSHGQFLPSANTSFYMDTGAENISFNDISDAPTGGAASLTNTAGTGTYQSSNRFTGSVQGPFLSVSTPSLGATSMDAGAADTPLTMNSTNTSATMIQMNNSTGHGWQIFASGSAGFFGGVTPNNWGVRDATTGTIPITASSSIIMARLPLSVGNLVPAFTSVPTGSCSTVTPGTLAIAQDGHAASCVGTTWTSRW